MPKATSLIVENCWNGGAVIGADAPLRLIVTALLGLGRATLYRKVEEYGIERK